MAQIVSNRNSFSLQLHRQQLPALLYWLLLIRAAKYLLLLIRAAKYLPSFFLSSSEQDSARSRRLPFFPLPPSAAPPPAPVTRGRGLPNTGDAGRRGHAATLGRWHEATRRRHRPSTDLRGRLFFCPCCGSARHLGLPAARHLFLSVARLSSATGSGEPSPSSSPPLFHGCSRRPSIPPCSP